MALMNCPECGKEISDKAKICIYCGYPLEEENAKKETDIQCQECGSKVYHDMGRCPVCGCPIKKGLDVEKPAKNNGLEKRAFAGWNKKIIWGFLALFIVVMCLLALKVPEKKEALDEDGVEAVDSVDFAVQDEKNEIENLAVSFFTDLQSDDLENTQKYLTENYNYLEHNPFGLSKEDNLRRLFGHYSYQVLDVSVNEEGNAAYINLEIGHPELTELLNAGTSNFSFDEENSIENGFMKKLDDPDLEIQVTDGSLNLIKVDGQWKINVDDFFFLCIFYGVSEESSFEKMAENEKKRVEEEVYIKEKIDLVDYRVGMMEGYSGKVPGINNISIKNNGDKQIDSLILRIDFLDESANAFLSKEITVLGIFDNPVPAGYSWKMEKDKFFEIKDIPDDIDLERVAVSISEVQLSDAPVFAQGTPESEYINQYLEIVNYNVGIKNGYRGKVPGVSDISIKNNGDRNLSELMVTVYFQDESGKNIAEDSFLIIGGFWGGDTLKANYSWKMENDKFFEFKNLASEVDISRNSIKITEIKFE